MTPKRTDAQPVGHISLGAIMLDRLLVKAAELTSEPFPSELRLRIHHLIASHHGTLEFGSPKVPMTPEAQALHLIDMLDSKMHQFLRKIRSHQADPGTQHTYKIPRIGKVLSSGQFEVVWTAAKPEAPLPYPTSRTAEQWRALLHDLYTGWGNQWAAPKN